MPSYSLHITFRHKAVRLHPVPESFLGILCSSRTFSLTWNAAESAAFIFTKTDNCDTFYTCHVYFITLILFKIIKNIPSIRIFFGPLIKEWTSKSNMAFSVSKKSEKREQFTEIYSDLYPLIFSSIKSKVDDYDDAADITHDVFETFYLKFDEVENPRKWLYGTLKKKVYQYYEKKNKRGHSVNTDELFVESSLIYVNGFRDARLIIEEAIEHTELTKEQRMVLNYVAFHTYSYSETGKIMGFSKDKVGYIFNNCVKKITDYLNSKGIRDIEELLDE